MLSFNWTWRHRAVDFVTWWFWQVPKYLIKGELIFGGVTDRWPRRSVWEIVRPTWTRTIFTSTRPCGCNTRWITGSPTIINGDCNPHWNMVVDGPPEEENL